MNKTTFEIGFFSISALLCIVLLFLWAYTGKEWFARFLIFFAGIMFGMVWLNAIRGG